MSANGHDCLSDSDVDVFDVAIEASVYSCLLAIVMPV